jgi:predicted  nucleic acid-binding Zn-ribbon protein
MTNTPIQISTDLKEYLDKFDQKLDRMDVKFDKLREEVTNIRIELVATQGSIKTLESELKGSIKTLEVEVQNVKKKVEEIDTVQKTLVKDVSDLTGAKSLVIPPLIAVLASSLTFFYRFIPIP